MSGLHLTLKLEAGVNIAFVIVSYCWKAVLTMMLHHLLTRTCNPAKFKPYIAMP